MPCSPINITQQPSGGGTVIPGFGSSFAPSPSANTTPIPSGFPEDLNEIVSAINLIVSSGTISSSLSVNFGKDIFDAIMNLMDKAFPFLMSYKMILPILNMIICIIEVICSLVNPFALISKIQRLFRVCLPEFLALFPPFALIVFILSLLILLVSLVEYIITKVLELVELLLANIEALLAAFSFSDQSGILAITHKIGLIICDFQNLSVLLGIFDVIIQIIKDILKLITAIPPCSDSGNTDPDDNTRCCAPPTCPSFLKNNEQIDAETGSMQYLNEVVEVLGGIPSQLYPILREESWQFYDAEQSVITAFSNITNAYDLPEGTTVIFFPTTANYTATTPISQVPYLVNMTLFYNPSFFDRVDTARTIQINNCIVLAAPFDFITNYNNQPITQGTGVLSLAGGLAYESDGTTPIMLNGKQATLNTLIHQAAPDEATPTTLPNDGYIFTNISYEFIIQHEILFASSLITLGCIPEVGFDRDFVNTVYGGNAGANLAQLTALINGNTFPDVAGAQQCLATALAGLAANVSTEGIATFQATATTCLTDLQNNATSSVETLVGIGFDPYQSIFTVAPTPQFTSATINVQVLLNETNGQNITTNMSASLGETLAAKLSAVLTFGTISAFVYDGSKFFNAAISSSAAGSGTIEVSFDGQLISTSTLPANLNTPPSISITSIPYTFVYSPFGVGSGNVQTGTGDTTGKPRNLGTTE